jgi:dipeptidyl aminopeptidase/acylaminoacyl peptidase
MQARWQGVCALLWLLCCPVALAWPAAQPPAATGFSLEQVLGYPFPVGLSAASAGNRIAWVIDQNGVRNIWMAQAPDFKPRQVTNFTQDDGQELTQLTFSPDGNELVFVRGGDHDANWEDPLPPDPSSAPVTPQVMLWVVDVRAGTARALTAGDEPALSATGRLAYIKDHQVWSMPLAATDKAKAQRLFFDRGKDGDLQWSPDGKRLAFVSNREDHAFIGVYAGDDKPITYLAPSTGIDQMPRWSADGKRLAFTRRHGRGGPPRLLLQQVPQPWSLMLADAGTGAAHVVWQSPDTLEGSYPRTAGGANLHWADGDSRLVFLADLDGWPHLYSIAAGGGKPLLLTPGQFMVEDVVLARDGRSVIYSANTGMAKDDLDRRHLFSVPAGSARPVALTSGNHIQTSPVAAGTNAIAYIDAGPRRPPLVALMDGHGAGQRILQADVVPRDFPTAHLLVPRAVKFTAADGTTIHGQLFRSKDAGAKQPGVIFVHGGPPRQMLLGWHYMDYYTNSYAVNQYLATHGFTVLSVNYRLGIGHGHAFHHPPKAGPAGASEYQDVVAGARFLQSVPGVDATRIGIWGGSYGGYLTALALARNSDIFKAGVDMHGLHDWSQDVGDWSAKSRSRYEQGDYQEALKVAWESSPDAAIATWKSPVLLIQGDDDRNVHFAQMEDVVPRLRQHQVPFEEMVLPNEIHGFLRHASWLQADTATVDFLQRKLGVSAAR